MSDEELTVGQTVARARRQAGLTVADVAERTRVRAALIEGIERDDFRLCGGDVYARGHLKSIASAVGLAPARVVEQFDRQQGAVRPEPTVVEPVAEPVPARAGAVSLGALAGPLGHDVEGRRGGGTNWTAVMALALVAIVAVGGISALSNRSSSDQTATPGASASASPSATPTTPDASPSASPSTPAVQPTPSPTDVVAEADAVTVALTVTGKAAWVRVTGGPQKKTLYEGTLTRGQEKTFRDDDQVNLVVGDAGAVSLVVNGRDLGEPGGQGQVVKLEFTPGDPTGQAG